LGHASPPPSPFLSLHPDKQERKKRPSARMATKYEGRKKRYRGGIHKSLFEKILVLLLHFIQSGGNVSLLQNLLFYVWNLREIVTQNKKKVP
jgi:hypothetical protein